MNLSEKPLVKDDLNLTHRNMKLIGLRIVLVCALFLSICALGKAYNSTPGDDVVVKYRVVYIVNLLLGTYRTGFVYYNGKYYATLTGVPYNDLERSSCQSNYLPLPSNWIIAPNSNNARFVLSYYTWSTHLMVLSDGSAYETYAKSGTFVRNQSLLRNLSAGTYYYSCAPCNCEIMIQYSDLNTGTSSTSGASVINQIIFSLVFASIILSCSYVMFKRWRVAYTATRASIAYYSRRRLHPSAQTYNSYSRPIVAEVGPAPMAVVLENPRESPSSAAVYPYPSYLPEAAPYEAPVTATAQSVTEIEDFNDGSIYGRSSPLRQQ